MCWKEAAKSSTLSPLRALASEKFEDFKKYTSIRKPDGRKVSVGISTGDFDSADNWLETLRRHNHNQRESRFAAASPRQMDGQHLTGNRRRNSPFKRGGTRTNPGNRVGKTLQVNPNIQILALSATINNVDEIAGWLNAKYIVTEWRPINLKEGIMLNDEIQYKDGNQEK